MHGWDGSGINPNHVATAAGKTIKTVTGGYYLVSIPKKVWSEINTGRKLINKEIQPLDVVNKEPWANNDYLGDWLAMVSTEIGRELNNKPTHEQVFIGWKAGLPALRKLHFDVSQVTDNELLRSLRLFMSIERENALNASSRSIPEPLPTDGRKPIPTRYPKEGMIKVEPVTGHALLIDPNSKDQSHRKNK